MFKCQMTIANNVFGIAKIAEYSEAIYTKLSQVGNPVLGDRFAWRRFWLISFPVSGRHHKSRHRHLHRNVAEGRYKD